jgi:hypothetical protein
MGTRIARSGRDHNPSGKTMCRKLLVGAAGMENGQYHQIRISEQPLFRLGAGRLGRPREESETLASRHVPEVLQTNAR